MPTVYWTSCERVLLNPGVGKSIYFAQSLYQLFTRSEFSSHANAAAKDTHSSKGDEYQHTTIQLFDESATEDHGGLCNLGDSSIRSAIERTQIVNSKEHSNMQEPVSSAKEMIKTSVIICTRFRSNELRKCLLKVAALAQKPDEIIIVDNSEGDNETEKLAREFSAVYVIERNVGLSCARNRGLAECNSEIVAYLDDDASPEEHWLERIREPFSDPRVAVVTGAAIDPNDAIKYPLQSELSVLDKSKSQWFEMAAFGGLGIGTNMALRKSACMAKLFDERLGRGAPFHGMEEHMAFARLISQGYRAVYSPFAVVYHTSQHPLVANREARTQFAYSMLLYSEFPDRRRDLLDFLFRRMRHKPLTWARNTPDPGIVVSSSWSVLIRGIFSGALLYLRTSRRSKA